MNNYSKKLSDPRWQKKRLEILQRDDFKCRCCGDDKSELHVHHLVYFAGTEIWEYPDSMMVTLCHTCHQGEHDNKNTESLLVELFNLQLDAYQIFCLTNAMHELGKKTDEEKAAIIRCACAIFSYKSDQTYCIP